MINLLPPEEKEKNLLEKKKRMVVILWLLALFFLVCLIFVLFSLRIYLISQVKAQKELLLETEQQIRQSELKELQERVNSTNLTLAKLAVFYQEKIYLTEILEKVSSLLPKEVYLTNFSAVLSRTEEEAVFKISLAGFAPNRELLFEFRKNLEKEAKFRDVYFPPANWVKAADIDFFVSFEIR